MSRKLNENDIRAIVTGSALLGAGGGGSLEAAYKMLEEGKKRAGELSLELIESSELAPGGSACVVTGYYLPDAVAGREAELLEAGVNALVSIRQSAYISGKRVEAAMPMDRGALSSLLPALACACEGLPLVDADGCGRGAADLFDTMFEEGDISFSPAVICDGKGNVVRVYPYNAADCKAASNMAYYFRAAFDNLSAIGAWLCGAADIEGKLSCGSLSLAEKIGRAMLDGNDCPCKAAGRLEEEFGFRTIAEGSVIEKCGDAISFKSDDGAVYTVKYDRAYRSIAKDGKPVADDAKLFCAIDCATGLPVPSDDVKIGQKLRWLAV